MSELSCTNSAPKFIWNTHTSTQADINTLQEWPKYLPGPQHQVCKNGLDDIRNYICKWLSSRWNARKIFEMKITQVEARRQEGRPLTA